MAKHDMFGRLAQQVNDRLQGASRGPEEVQRAVQGAMRSAFDRMELVSREDFDVMMEVLQRTRSRVETLERRVEKLEAALDGGPASMAAGEAVSASSASSASTATETPPADDDSAEGSPRASGKRASGGDDRSGQGSAD